MPASELTTGDAGTMQIDLEARLVGGDRGVD
jgi:hypothetical protein